MRLTGSAHSTEETRQPMSPTEREGVAQIYRSRNDQADRLDLAVVDRASGVLVGEVVLNDWQEENQCCNYRILIGSVGQNRGLGTEATRLILNYGFETLGLHRISLSVFSFNPRAQRAYEKAGFRQEGVLRSSFCFDGVWHDELLYSILADEWKQK